MLALPFVRSWFDLKKRTPVSRGSAGILPVMAGMLPARIQTPAF
jgi:hypothetical protein